VLIPLVHARTVRLTTRRLEAVLPESMAEVQAEKDLLPAEFAMSTRRLESLASVFDFSAGEGSNRRRDAVKWRGFQLRARKIVRGLNQGLTQEERTRSLRRVPHSRRAQRPAQ
jgi:hypothetical protein